MLSSVFLRYRTDSGSRQSVLLSDFSIESAPGG